MLEKLIGLVSAPRSRVLPHLHSRTAEQLQAMQGSMYQPGCGSCTGTLTQGQSKTATKTAPGAGVWFSPNAPTWEQLEEIAR